MSTIPLARTATVAGPRPAGRRAARPSGAAGSRTGGRSAPQPQPETQDPGTPGGLRQLVGFVGQVVAWLVILAVAAVLTAAVLLPRTGGATPYTVLTGSMRPGMPPGTLVVAKPVDPATLQVGDVITFQLESGKAAVVTHRIIGIRQGADGLEFLTQGDANPAMDAGYVRAVQIRGERWYSVPHLGRANVLLSGHERQVAVYVVSAGLALYAGGMFAGAARDRRRRGPRPATGRHRA